MNQQRRRQNQTGNKEEQVIEETEEIWKPKPKLEEQNQKKHPWWIM